MPQRVLIVDDNRLFRDVLSVLVDLDPELELCGAGADGAEAVALASTLRPDVVILDSVLPVRTGLDALPLIKEVVPDTSVVMYSSDDQPESVRLARARGATAYFIKGIDDVAEVLTAAGEAPAAVYRVVCKRLA
jgi:two-component system NarL family response regulator